ncbi:putative oxidoreductase YtbE [Anatilimnocola aggregata]|uniref:Putative oxidoreductase YtbE n=1 Tax=Anatilimnocola aggregata TaxID=2528021 RepID=A0A517YLJ2_9BACT|nr:aldo/keto reductase [Anatilimnocola aggregata]QDU31089.1 putative oxidoreductase YtbE [Anatilimnocola aggregata]
MIKFLYGTAWKEAETARLALLALEQGFRGIDTANQRKHYHEAGVGEAVARAIERGLVAREELFLQTKFTFLGGQDQRLPYDPQAPIARQVEQSFASSLVHLGTDYLDSYVLHGPSQRVGLGADDWAAWRAMEGIHASGSAKVLGISNVSREQLEQLCQQAKVQPRFVQNRCYASRGWDRAVREFCKANDITYQGFSLLTANREVLVHPAVEKLAQRYQRTTSQIVFRFACDIGMLPLTGTTNAAHMQADLSIFDFQLDPAEVALLESIAG